MMRKYGRVEFFEQFQFFNVVKHWRTQNQNQWVTGWFVNPFEPRFRRELAAASRAVAAVSRQPT
jgi:hypothetical protein